MRRKRQIVALRAQQDFGGAEGASCQDHLARADFVGQLAARTQLGVGEIDMHAPGAELGVTLDAQHRRPRIYPGALPGSPVQQVGIERLLGVQVAAGGAIPAHGTGIERHAASAGPVPHGDGDGSGAEYAIGRVQPGGHFLQRHIFGGEIAGVLQDGIRRAVHPCAQHLERLDEVWFEAIHERAQLFQRRAARSDHDAGVDQGPAAQAIRHQRAHVRADAHIEQALTVADRNGAVRRIETHMSGQVAQMTGEGARQIFLAAFEYANLDELAFVAAASQTGRCHGAAIATAHDQHIKIDHWRLFVKRGEQGFNSLREPCRRALAATLFNHGVLPMIVR